MSTFNEIDIACPECGEGFKGTVWTAIHAGEDPELKDLLLGGELNIVVCPKCSHVTYQDHFVLYQEPAAELVAYIYPPAQQADEAFLRRSMNESFHEAQKIAEPKLRKNYDPVLLFGLEAFVEMMLAEDARAEQSQIAEALCKENHLPFVVLRPSEARSRGITRVLPTRKHGPKPGREEILGGLERLLAINPTLDLYSTLLRTIQQNASWSLA